MGHISCKPSRSREGSGRRPRRIPRNSVSRLLAQHPTPPTTHPASPVSAAAAGPGPAFPRARAHQGSSVLPAVAPQWTHPDTPSCQGIRAWMWIWDRNPLQQPLPLRACRHYPMSMDKSLHRRVVCTRSLNNGSTRNYTKKFKQVSRVLDIG